MAEGGVESAGDNSAPLIVYNGHIHPLTFLEDSNSIDHDKSCDACGKPCEDSPMFCCVSCDFSIHLLCGPLPRALKQEIHRDVLILKDFLVPNHDDKDWYCDSCEDVRDKRACVYYCRRCDYGVEIKCMMPELLLALSGKAGDVELRTLGRWNFSGKVISKGLSPEEMQKYVKEAEEKIMPACYLEDILQSLTEDDKTELDNILKSEEKLFEESKGLGYGIQLDSGFCLDEEFLQLNEKLDSVPLSSLSESWDLRMPFVKVGDVLVPMKLAPVYTDLYKKYGDDLSAGSKPSPELKPLFILFLCRAVEGMWAVKLIDLTEDVLTEWFITLKAVHRAGFKIQFAIDALRKVLFAYFSIRVMNSEDKISQEISSLEGKRGTLEEVRGKLKEHEEYFDNIPQVLRDCIEEAPELMHLAVSEIIFGIKGERRTEDDEEPPSDYEA